MYSKNIEIENFPHFSKFILSSEKIVSLDRMNVIVVNPTGSFSEQITEGVQEVLSIEYLTSKFIDDFFNE